MLISNGNVSDMEATIEAVVAASDVPISIIVIGIGDGEDGQGTFTKLESLDADDEILTDCNGKQQSRDVV